MPRPGVTVEITDEVFAGAAVLDTGQSFMVGKAEKGSAVAATKIRSMKEYAKWFGTRAGGSSLHDGASTFFDEGGGTLYVARAIGTGAIPAFTTALGTQLRYEAVSPGVWGNSLKVKANAPPAGVSGIYLTVLDAANSDALLDQSPPVTTPQDLINWSIGRPYVAITATGGAPVLPSPPNVVTLSGGADGAAPGDTEYVNALGLFGFELGPGQVSMPGMTTIAKQNGMMQHCLDNFRVCILDLPDDPTLAALSAAIGAIYAHEGSKHALACGSWLVYPYSASGSSVVVPYSGVQSGLIARADKLGDPSVNAAGVNGISRRAIGLHYQRTDADRETLNDLGVCLAKQVYGQVRTYGYRVAAGPSEENWRFFQESRVVMSIAHRCNAAMEEFVFNAIDGRGHLFAKIHGVLMGICSEFFLANALYGAQPEDAFQVDVAGQNTVETIALGEVHASVKVKTSKSAEWVEINLVKTPLERTF